MTTPNPNAEIEAEAWRLFNAPGKELPPNLAKTLTNVGRKLGMSGDGFMDVTVAWLKHAKGWELSYEEVLALWSTANG